MGCLVAYKTGFTAPTSASTTVLPALGIIGALGMTQLALKQLPVEIVGIFVTDRPRRTFSALPAAAVAATLLQGSVVFVAIGLAQLATVGFLVTNHPS